MCAAVNSCTANNIKWQLLLNNKSIAAVTIIAEMLMQQ